MNEFEIEFCKKRGMEFPNGPERICPLCGNDSDRDNDPDEDLKN